MTFPVDEFRRGYDVDENASRFSNYFHVLREVVHLSNGWLPLVGDFELKYRLGDHLHDDARSISKVRRRLYELRHPSDYPGTPGDELTALLERLNSAGKRRRVRRARLRRGEAAAHRRRSASTSTASIRSRTSRRCGC